MKKFLTISFLLLLCYYSFGQPSNDDCAGAINIPLPPAGPPVCNTYDNIGASADVTNVNFTPIGLSCNPTNREVWFSFTTPVGTLIPCYNIQVTGITMTMPRITFLRGDCTEFEASACNDAAVGSNFVELELPEGTLDPGETYYFIVSDWSNTAGSNEGTFDLCIEECVPLTDVCTDASTTQCSGTTYDSGGDTGNYGLNENCTFTITPNVNTQCIIVTVNTYDIETGFDFLNIYDGATITGPLLGSVTGTGGNLEFQAASGSVTFQFTSDGSVVGNGFEISWQCTGAECTVPLPIDVTNTGVSIDDLVEALSSPQVIVSNPILSCADGAYGVFNAPTYTDNFDLGDEGIILTTGSALNAEGPNNSGSTSQNNGQPGDPDLDAISTGSTSNDACILEFDVYAATDELVFDYVFGSEEYEEFVNSNFNDIFAFFISGPGLAPNTNIAVLQDGTTPVSINSVNQNFPFDPVTGDAVYQNNAGGISVEYDGLTSTLTARADVIPCNFYHLKLAIADRGDFAFDSGVFVADLKAGLPEIETNFVINSTINLVVEGCSTNDFIDIVLSQADDDEVVYYTSITGNALSGIDVNAIPDSLVFAPGQTSQTIPFVPVNDGIDEGIENITITLFRDFGCGAVVYDSVQVFIADELDVQTTQDTFYVCQGTSSQIGVTGASLYTWTPDAELDNANSPFPTITPTTSGPIYVTGASAGCQDSDTAYIQIVDPTISISTPPSTVCEGSSIQLTAVTNTNGQGVTWSPITGVDDPTSATPNVSPQNTTTYTATVTAGGCSETASVTITVDPLNIPNLIPNATICQGTAITLSGTTNANGTTYQWSPSESLNDATIPNPSATPQTTTTYSVISTSANGACTDTSSVTITVLPADVDILGPDTIYVCVSDLPQTFDFEAVTSTAGLGLSWSASDGSLSSTSTNVTVSPSSTTTYTATLQVGTCIVTDQVVVSVEDLPPLDLVVSVPAQGITNVINPDTVTLCANDIVVVNTVYDPNPYPIITHEWFGNGLPIGQSTANMFATPPATTLYVRETINGACVQRDSFVAFVNLPPDVTISPIDTAICAGESVQLNVTGGSFTWIPNDGSLSSTTINNPIATPAQTTEYVAQANVGGCNIGISTIVTVGSSPTNYTVAGDATICSGDVISLGNDTNDPSYTYAWSNGDTTPNPTVSPTNTTDYSVTITSGGCEVIENITITVSVQATANFTGNTLICEGETTTITANTNGTVTWFNIDGNLLADANNPVQDITLTTTDTFYVNISNGACVGSDTIIIQVDENPTYSLVNNTAICEGSSIEIGDASNDASYTYSWTPSTSLNLDNPENPIANPSVSTVYDVTIQNGLCTITDQVTVNVDANPNLNITGDNSICDGENTILTANTDVGTVEWTGGVFAVPNATSQTVSPSTNTTYYVTATNGTCVENDSTEITVFDQPVLTSSGDVTICEGDQVNISANTTAGTLTWSGGAFANPNASDQTVAPTATTTYTINADNNGCTDQTSLTVTVISTSISVSSDVVICDGESAILTATTSGSGTITWTDEAGNIVGTGSSVSVNPSDDMTYTAEYSDGACSASNQVTVTVGDNFDIDITALPDVEIESGTELDLTANVLNGNPTGLTFNWSASDGASISDTDDNIQIVPTQENTTYSVTATSDAGCTATAQIDITLLFPSEVGIPNVFTPTGDNLNDKFFPIVDFNAEIVEFKVFDRWGEMVHDDINEGWDGTYNGEAMPSDVYAYYVIIKYGDGTEEIRKGAISLVR